EALKIVAGFPGVKRGAAVALVAERVPGTKDFQHESPSLIPFETDFEYGGKVAVLIDGMTFSAADYFARAAARFTDAILVGAPASGSYGGGDQGLDIGDDPFIHIRTDPYRVTDENDQNLEGQSAAPSLAVELAPKDLAAGVDTVLEAAVARLAR